MKPASMYLSKYLHAHLPSKATNGCKDLKFNYHSVIGKLQYVAQTLLADIIIIINE